MDGTFYAEEYFGSKDDAFEKGQSFGMYFEQYDILDEITTEDINRFFSCKFFFLKLKLIS